MFPSVYVDVNMHQQVLVRNACCGGDSKQGGDLQSLYNEIGRFSSDLHKKLNPSSRQIPKCGYISQSHPLSKQPSLFSVQNHNHSDWMDHFDWMDMNVPETIRAELREYLRE
jgi:hypothetical protein